MSQINDALHTLESRPEASLKADAEYACRKGYEEEDTENDKQSRAMRPEVFVSER